MRAQTIPVVLLFSNVAANSNLSINLTSPGVKWSLGGSSPDSLGFSYNVIPDNPDNSNSCIQSISFDDDVLVVVTSPTAPEFSSFTLTLALTVEDAEYLQGYCTLNNEAVVLVYFGVGGPVQWRNGRISAVLHPTGTHCVPVLLSIKGAPANARVEITVGTPPGGQPVEWTLGPEGGSVMGLTLYGGNGPIGLSKMLYSGRRITLQTAPSGGGQQASAIGLVAFLSWQAPLLPSAPGKHPVPAPGGPPCVYLRLGADPGTTATCQVGNHQPQAVSATDTLFML